MGNSKITNILKFTASLMLGSIGVVSSANAMPVDPNLGKLEASSPCIQCQIERETAGLGKTRNDLLHMVSIISPDGKDPRKPQDRSGKGNQFAPIGALRPNDVVYENGKQVLNTESKAQGTAFLVGPCLILTEAHVVYGDDLSPKHAGDVAMTFEAGERGTANHEVAIARSFISGPRVRVTSTDMDFALLKLDQGADGRCMGDRIGWMKLDPNDSGRALSNLTFAGFPADKPDSKLTAQKGSRILDFDGLPATDAAGIPGDSGGPLMEMQQGHAPTVFAMMSSTVDPSSKVYRKLTGDNVNHITQISDFVDGIAGVVAANCAGKRNPLETSSSSQSITVSSAK